MISKKQLKLFLYYNFIVAIIIGSTNYIANPFYLFHKPIWNKLLFTGEEVFQNLGLIETFLKKTDDYDSILIGTSHTKNFIGNEISQVLNSKGTLKLCLGAGHPVELETIAKAAFKSKKIKKVLWGFETIHFTLPAYTTFSGRIFPHCLHESKLKKFSLIFTIHMLKQSIGTIIYRLFDYPLFINLPTRTSLNKIHYWYDIPHILKRFDQFSSFQNLQIIKGQKDKFNNHKDQFPSQSFSAIDEHFIPLIRNHPEIEFYVVLIPYSCAYFIGLDETKYQNHLACQQYLIKKCSKYPNIRFYAFHTCQFPHNLANYRDRTHHHEDINRYMLYAIEKDYHRLTLSNLDTYEKAMISNLKSFEVKDAYPKKDTLEDLIKNEKKSFD